MKVVRSYSATFVAMLCALGTSASALAQSCAAGVRASNPSSFYIVASGTATDLRSGLMWDQCPWGQSGNGCAVGTSSVHTWQEALAIPAIANALVYKSFTDWRIPNLKELRSIVEECRVSPSINEMVFPTTTASNYWSSSPHGYDATTAWDVDFFNGISAVDSRDFRTRVRLVRNAR